MPCLYGSGHYSVVCCVIPYDFCAKIDFFALKDCFGVILCKNGGVQFFRPLDPSLGVTFQKWATRADPNPSSTNNEPILMILVSF